MARYFKWIGWSSILFSLTTGVSAMDKFYWQATECAPEGFPMQIVKGDFIYSDGGSLYVPDGKRIYHGWGFDVSSHVVGPDLKPLPKQLSITFFSYTENQFYEGKFDLPYEKILSMFNEGYYSPKEGKQITYIQLMAGITPGGVVSVWLSGIDKTTEVFLGQAEKTEVDFKIIIDNPKYPRDEYVRLNVQEMLSPEEIALLKKNGIPFDRWDIYHQKRYQWQPVFSGFEVIDGLIDLIKYYNGEEGYLYHPLNEDEAKNKRAVPKEIHFIWKHSEKKNLMYEIYFDEAEVFELFDKLGKDNQPLRLELKMIETEQGRQFGVLLRNDEEGIYFRKIKVKKYRA